MSKSGIVKVVAKQCLNCEGVNLCYDLDRQIIDKVKIVKCKRKHQGYRLNFGEGRKIEDKKKCVNCANRNIRRGCEGCYAFEGQYNNWRVEEKRNTYICGKCGRPVDENKNCPIKEHNQLKDFSGRMSCAACATINVDTGNCEKCLNFARIDKEAMRDMEDMIFSYPSEVKFLVKSLKHDSGKLRYDLVPPIAAKALATVLTYGAKKYKANSRQELGDFQARYTAALFRHIEAWRAGELYDKESGIQHLAHALCNLVFLLWYDMRLSLKIDRLER